MHRSRLLSLYKKVRMRGRNCFSSLFTIAKSAFFLTAFHSLAYKINERRKLTETRHSMGILDS